VAEFNLLPIKMFYKKNLLATILSFHDVVEVPGVTIRMDSSKERAIFVSMPDSNVLKFTESSLELYYFDVDKLHKTASIAYSVLSTAQHNKRLYSKQEFERARKACHYQALLGWPSMSSYLAIIKHKLTINCDITKDDILRAKEVYGPAVPILKKKMKQLMPVSHPKTTRVRLPMEFLNRH